MESYHKKERKRDKFDCAIIGIFICSIIVSFNHTIELYKSARFDIPIDWLNNSYTEAFFGKDFFSLALFATLSAEAAFSVGLWGLYEAFRIERRFPGFWRYKWTWGMFIGGLVVIGWSNIGGTLGYNYLFGNPIKGLVLGLSIPYFVLNSVLVNFSRSQPDVEEVNKQPVQPKLALWAASLANAVNTFREITRNPEHEHLNKKQPEQIEHERVQPEQIDIEHEQSKHKQAEHGQVEREQTEHEQRRAEHERYKQHEHVLTEHNKHLEHQRFEHVEHKQNEQIEHEHEQPEQAISEQNEHKLEQSNTEQTEHEQSEHEQSEHEQSEQTDDVEQPTIEQNVQRKIEQIDEHEQKRKQSERVQRKTKLYLVQGHGQSKVDIAVQCALKLMEQNKEFTVRELAKMAGCSPATALNALKKLEQQKKAQ